MKNISDYLSYGRRGEHLKGFTVFMFFCLAFEKILSGETFIYKGGHVDAYYAIDFLDIVCVLVYVATAVLLLVGVKNKLLLIPDFVLLAVKILIVISCFSQLAHFKVLSTTEIFTYIENIAESLSFSAFLVILFAGKLQKRDNKFHKIYPYICLALLGFCFLVTLGFEVGKLFVAVEDHLHPILTLINFAKNVINEAFLDLPYFLLVLYVCFAKTKEKAEINN